MGHPMEEKISLTLPYEEQRAVLCHQPCKRHRTHLSDRYLFVALGCN